MRSSVSKTSCCKTLGATDPDDLSCSTWSVAAQSEAKHSRVGSYKEFCLLSMGREGTVRDGHADPKKSAPPRTKCGCTAGPMRRDNISAQLFPPARCAGRSSNA